VRSNFDAIYKSNRHDASSKYCAPASPTIAEGSIVPLARRYLMLERALSGKQRVSAASVGVTIPASLLPCTSNEEPKYQGQKVAGDEFHKSLGPTYRQVASVWE
jgi:hypothetical protein